MKRQYIYKIILLIIAVAFTSCEDDRVLPVLSADSGTFVNPVLENAATKEAVELLPEDATELYEEFSWSRADYGVKLPVNYTVEVDKTSDFSAPVELILTPNTSVEISVDDFNDAILSLGLPAFEESTVMIRVRAIVTGGSVQSISSVPITRVVTSYQLSDCGDYCTIGIVGDATPGGWDIDTDMRLLDLEGNDKNTWTVTLKLTAGNAKFRAMDAWAGNWGSNSFPSGTGTQDGDNIPIPTEGYYKVVFNDKTGDYTFTLLTATVYPTVGVIGSATTGGWDNDIDLTKDSNDPHLWKGQITFFDGEAKFRANDSWDMNWGANTFPSGYATGNGPNIPVTAGTYFVWFHDVTGEYALMRTGDNTPYESMGVIGTATPGGWDEDTDLIKNPTNPYRWSKVMILEEGEAKIRADNGWDNNWGGATLPKGIGAKGGPNMEVKSGTYVINFHSGTGEYHFLR